MTCLGDQQVYEVASVVGVDRVADIAILKLAKNAPDHLDACDPKIVRQGLGVLCYGNPKGLNATLSTGIISSVDLDRHGRIQIDGNISPGNSGGPVVTTKGQVVGVIVSKIVADGVAGLNFAVPMTRVSTIPTRKLTIVQAGLGLMRDTTRMCITGNVEKINETELTLNTAKATSRNQYVFKDFGLLESTKLNYEDPIIGISQEYSYDSFGIGTEESFYMGSKTNLHKLPMKIANYDEIIGEIRNQYDPRQEKIYLYTGDDGLNGTDSKVIPYLSQFLGSVLHTLPSTTLADLQQNVYSRGLLLYTHFPLGVDLKTHDYPVMSARGLNEKWYTLDKKGNWQIQITCRPGLQGLPVRTSGLRPVIRDFELPGDFDGTITERRITYRN